MSEKSSQLHVSIVVIPEAMASTLVGMYEVLGCFGFLGSIDDSLPRSSPFRVELVASSRAILNTAGGLPVVPQRAVEEVDHTDIIIIPSILVNGASWEIGRYPELVDWMKAMHAQGAELYSACSGVLLLAETGLIDGLDATLHWAYEEIFRQRFPQIPLKLEKVLVATGKRNEFVMSGASASWHDLIFYLVSRHVGPTAAQAISKFWLLQWHADGQTPYITFQAKQNHGDAVIAKVQEWLAKHYMAANPVEEMVVRSGLPERSFKRRFGKATGHTPIAYVQQLRVHEAKRRLERTNVPVDEICWAVGYEDPAFFRRLFKRISGITPSAYRQKFQLPDFLLDDLGENYSAAAE